MIQNKLIDPNIVKESNPLYFAHYLNEDEIKQIDSTTPLVKQFFSDLDKLKNDNWKYHKELIKQGINPKEIAQVIRDDNDEKLQILASQKRFDFNQRIQPSLYEKCTFINNNNVSLVDYAAFYGSLKCFKFLMLNGSRIMNSGKYSVVGGNLEIFHICEQNHSPFDGAYEAAIEFHRNDIFKYIFENKIQKIESLSKLGEKCIAMDNYELLWFLEENGMKIDDFIINESAKVGNILLVKYFIEGKQIPEDVLVSATLSENVELTKYLLEEEGVNSNSGNIYLFNLKFVLFI